MRNKRLIVLFSILMFVTLLALLGSVVFSVQNVYAYCYNARDDEMDAKVASMDNNGISRGRSIFMLNESSVRVRVEENFPQVRVINVERKFPNQVYINYVRIFEYLAVETDDGVLYVSNDRLTVLGSGERRDAYPDHIRLVAPTDGINATVGEALLAPGKEAAVTADIMDVMERMDLKDEMVDLIELIDITYAQTDDAVWLCMRTGTAVKIMGTDRIAEKMRLAISLYLSDDTAYMNGGVITAGWDYNGGCAKVFYSSGGAYPGGNAA